MSFQKLLEDGFSVGKRLSVGIDPHRNILDSWGLDFNANGAETFARTVVDAASEYALCIKPQVAFFERFGSAGYAALERVFTDARQAGLAIIADAKRGDIGSTFDAYAETWLGEGSPLEADALTVVAYQGFGVLKRALELAETRGKGIFVLAATSNPEAETIQRAVTTDGTTVAASILQEAINWNETQVSSVGNVGVVLGATVNLTDYGIESALLKEKVLPVLAPGFGHQGAKVQMASKIFGDYSQGLIVHESRSLTGSGAESVRDIIADHAETIRSQI